MPHEPMNPDLHCHSTVSDGLLSPADVARRAHANGVDLLALTDHDEVGGIDEARAVAGELGLGFVPGVEISVSFAGETIHIVGLGIDHRHPELVAGLRQVREGRDARAARIGDELARVGIPGALEGARGFAGNPALVSRAHFARFLVTSGVMPDVKTVFDHYLVRGKPGFVEHEWAQLEEAVGWIRAAGGIAVVAHPARYRLSTADMKRCSSTASRRLAARRWRWCPAPTRRRRRPVSPARHAVAACWPRALPTSTARRKARLTWGAATRCRPI